MALVLVACAPARSPNVTERKWVSPLGRGHALVGRVWDVAHHGFVAESVLVDAVVKATFVGLGEQHDNVDHHDIQAHLIDAITSRGRSPGVVFEMLDCEKEGLVQRALQSHGRDPDAVARAVDWAHSGWPSWAIYRPVFAAAVEKELPLFAAGVRREMAMRLGVEGPGAAPVELVRKYGLDVDLPADAQEGMRAEMRDAHCGLMPEPALDGMVFVQRVRDAELADGLARAGATRGGVLIAGNGHVRRDRGVPALVRARSGATVLAVALIEVRDEMMRPADYRSAFGASELPFDYVVFTPRASDEDHCAKIRAH